MSRIGKKPINIASGVKVTLAGQKITVEGPKGRLERIIHDQVEVKMEADQLLVTARSERSNTAFQGLMRSLIANMVDGVTNGFSKVLEINGVGYRAELKGFDSEPLTWLFPSGCLSAAERDLCRS